MIIVNWPTLLRYPVRDRKCNNSVLQYQQLEAFQAGMVGMIKNPGKKVNDLGARSILGSVIKDQNLFSFLAGKQKEEIGKLNSQE